MKVKKNDALPSKNKKLVEKKKTDQNLGREIAVELKGVSKVYTLHHEKPTFVEQLFSKNKREKFKALDNIDLTIFKGEKIGIIGNNGSGKTTILKIISKIVTPTKGSVQTVGKVVSLIDLTAGFRPDLSGYENIFLNGLVIGMCKSDIKNKINDIVEFSGIGDFIYSPIYTYSEGMKLRLGFSIAIHADPDILILDEVIAAGDLDFYRKSGERINQMFIENKTIIIVSHLLDYLKKNCNKFVVVKEGRIIKSGGKDIVDFYKT